MSGEPDHMLGMINEIMAINPLPSYYTDVMGHVKMTSLPDITNDGYDELLIVPAVAIILLFFWKGVKARLWKHR